jgi:integrase
MATITERIGIDGSKTYQVKVRLKGFPIQTATFDRKTDAKNWATVTEAAIKEGRHFKTSTAKKHTVGDLIDEYITNVIPKKGTQGPKQEAQLEWWDDAIGAYSLSAVTPNLLAKQRDILLGGATSRGDHRSPATVNRYISALSHAFTYAVRELEWLEENPIRKMERPSEPEGRERYLDEDELDRLLASCKNSRNHLLYPFVLLALSTGMRYSEIANLYRAMPNPKPQGTAWGVIELERSRIVLHQTKNEQKRVIPLAGRAKKVLEDVFKSGDSALLFPSSKDNSRPLAFRTAFENAASSAGIDNFRFHDLRHTCASYLVMNGASLAEVAEILGHKTLQMVQRYAHLSDSHVAGVLEKMNKRYIR